MSKPRIKEGYIYIISNSNFPNYYKIGVTKNISARLRTYQTSSPHRNFNVEYYIHHPNCYVAEQKIHENILPFALEVKHEWIKIDLNMAKSRLDEVLESYNNGEWK